MTPEVHITAESQARWSGLCREWVKQTGREVGDVLTWSGWQTAKSARSHTRICKAKLGLRDIESNPKPPPKYVIRVWRQSVPAVSMVPTDDLADRRRVIKYVGAARNSWNGVMRGLNKPASPSSGLGEGTDTGSARKHLTASMPYIEMQNDLSYMPAIFPDAWEASFDRTMKQMEYRLQKASEKALDKALRI